MPYTVTRQHQGLSQRQRLEVVRGSTLRCDSFPGPYIAASSGFAAFELAEGSGILAADMVLAAHNSVILAGIRGIPNVTLSETWTGYLVRDDDSYAQGDGSRDNPGGAVRHVRLAKPS